MSEIKVDIAGRRLGVIINAASGGSDASTRERMAAVLAEVGITPTKYWEVTGKELEGALKEAQAYDVLISLG
ncbi:MAG TPA: hypothetical protein PK109_03725, partial [Candidatus Paceibacterota bacterium]|nr:hypothetical protein [Candidatus Paceibacterota bacterium]